MLGRALTGFLILFCFSHNAVADATEPVPGAVLTAPAPVPLQTLPENWLEQGIQLYQKGSYPEAESLFLSAILQHPNESRAYYNLGLVEFKLNKTGLALARWRQALDRASHFPQAREALRYARTQGPSLDTADLSPLWWTHTGLFSEVSLSVTLGCEAFFLLIFGVSMIRAQKLKRAPEKAEGVKNGRRIFITILFILSTIVTALKLWDDSTAWGTAIGKKVAAHSTSSEDSATLFEIPEGQEVIILRTEGGWYEIQMPSEKVGWLAPASILPTSGE